MARVSKPYPFDTQQIRGCQTAVASSTVESDRAHQKVSSEFAVRATGRCCGAWQPWRGHEWTSAYGPSGRSFRLALTAFRSRSALSLDLQDSVQELVQHLD